MYDFVDEGLGKAIPYGVYDVSANLGWVSVVSSTTQPRVRWRPFGLVAPDGFGNVSARTGLRITADGGGANQTAKIYRARLWQVEL